MKTTLHALVRLGYFAKAVVYLLMGVLAMRVAAGVRGGRITDQGGALYVVLAQEWGRAMLIGVAVGLLTYAAFQIWRAATVQDQFSVDDSIRVRLPARIDRSPPTVVAAEQIQRDGGGIDLHV